MMKRTVLILAMGAALTRAFSPGTHKQISHILTPTTLRTKRTTARLTIMPHDILAQSNPQQTSTTLYMSDVPSPRRENKKFELPPSPEDALVMGGDIVALFVYSFMDHSLNDLYMEQAQRGGMSQYLGEMQNGGQLPVWFDASHSTTMTTEHILTIIGLPQVYYSPIINTAGVSFILLSLAWLVAGYWSGAFLFRNTLDCGRDRALMITFQTWLICSSIMVGLAFGSDQLLDFGGLTKADADYIFDSLTVLVTWRFMVNWMLGYGK